MLNLKTLWHSDANWRHVFLSTLVQIMTYRLHNVKPVPESELIYCQVDLPEHLSIRFNIKFIVSFQKNTVEKVVCEMVPIFLVLMSYKLFTINKIFRFFRVAGAFTLDVIARTGFGIAVNSQKDKDDEFFVTAKAALNFDITRPLLIIASTFCFIYIILL